MPEDQNNNDGSPSYRKATYKSAVRMVRLVDEMPKHGLGRRLESVAKGLGVSKQTVKRYVKALQDEFVTESGEPQFVIKKEGDEEWLVRRSKYDEKARANIYQLISVYLSLEIFKMLGANNLFMDLVDDVLGEVEQKLTSAHRGLIKDLARKFYSEPWAPKDYSQHDEVLSNVIKALVYQNVININYKPGGCEPCDYTIQPLTLLYHRGGLYLIARAIHHQQPVYFNIERLQEVQVTPDKFDYPEKYHPAQMMDGAFGIFTGGEKKTFRLRFPPQLKDYICSRQWHKSQHCEVHGDGSVTLTLTVTDSEEVRSWIRGFGDNVSML
ncbi:MAG: WYL domain-containing protein [bacterium]